MSDVSAVKALVFDVFGTVVDWRGSIARELDALGLGVDASAFADAWRARYQPAMQAVRSGTRPWVRLDVLHRENLDATLAAFGVAEHLDEAARVALNLAWMPLTPQKLVEDLWTRPARLAAAAPELSRRDRALLQREPGAPWTAADVPLLDEAAERKKAIAATEPAKFEERMNFLVDNITFKVFDATRRGLLERHKLILATQLLLRFDEQESDRAGWGSALKPCAGLLDDATVAALRGAEPIAGETLLHLPLQPLTTGRQLKFH
jgi:hypothetical protein